MLIKLIVHVYTTSFIQKTRKIADIYCKDGNVYTYFLYLNNVSIITMFTVRDYCGIYLITNYVEK